MSKLSQNFINELFKLALMKKDIEGIVKQFVEYYHIPDEWRHYKKVLKSIKNNNSDALLSYGIISQQFINDVDVQEVISLIKEANVVDKDQILEQLEKFIKNQEFKELNRKIVELYKEDKIEEAQEYQAKKSVEIVNLSLRKEANRFVKVYGGFKDRIKDKQNEQEQTEVHVKVPFGIDILDDRTYGGMDVTDTFLWILRSGDGKSTILRDISWNASKLGTKVLHIQLEGSEREVTDKYDQMWTMLPLINIKKANIPADKVLAIDKKIKEAEIMGKEIDVIAFEKFENTSMYEIRDVVLEYHKINGFFPELIIIDYIQLLTTGENKKLDYDPAYEKKKLNRVAELMKNIAVEFKTRVGTAIQTSDVPFNIWNDPDKVLTRSDTEADKTIIKSFSHVFSSNRTLAEIKNNSARIYIDKIRNYKIGEPIVKIKTAYDAGRYYDKLKTLRMYDEKDKL